MKRIMTTVAVAAMLFVSCSKMEQDEGIDINGGNEKITLNLSVSNPCSDDSKAMIKTGWAVGDQLLIWYDSNVGQKPDMAIRYDGGNWINDESVEVSGNIPASSGQMKALYNNTLIVTAKDPYTFARNTLSGKIQNWTFLTEIQVVVTGITPEDADKYTLSCDKFTTCTGFVVGTDAITATAGEAGDYASGISNADGVAFVFASSTAYNISTSFKFDLNDGTSGSTSISVPTGTPSEPESVDLGLPSGVKWATQNIGASKPQDYGYHFFWGGTQGYVYCSSGGYTVNKTIEKDVTRIKAIKIAKSKFTTRNFWAEAETGKELVDGFCWKNTPFNNGSTKYDATYFSSVKATVCSDDILVKDYDAAHAYLGDNWRMPTSAELNELYENTTNAWVTDYEGTGINGWLFTSKKDSSKSIFLPAAGNGHNNDYSVSPSRGDYWSSSICPNNYQPSIGVFGDNSDAFELYFYRYPSGFEYIYPLGITCRYFGFSIRPVSN